MIYVNEDRYYDENPREWSEVLEALGSEATITEVVTRWGGKTYEEILDELLEMWPYPEDREAVEELAAKIYSLVP